MGVGRRRGLARGLHQAPVLMDLWLLPHPWHGPAYNWSLSSQLALNGTCLIAFVSCTLCSSSQEWHGQSQREISPCLLPYAESI